MDANTFQGSRHSRAAVIARILLLGSLAACATAGASTTGQREASSALTDPKPLAPASIQPPAQLIRSGRYTLIELGPEDGQRNLLQQVVQTSIPPSTDATVGDALRFLLFRTGYQMCEEESSMKVNALPLPAAHLRLGPMTLQQALLTLIGTGWALHVDEVNRRVCIAPMDSSITGSLGTVKSNTSSAASTASPPDQRAQPSEVRP